jgi:aspartate ammonia-lyase
MDRAARYGEPQVGIHSGADAIVESCEELRAGKLHDQFVVDAIQGGAGTSTNMNANEVIANRALELLGHARRLRRRASERARERVPVDQ